MIIENLDVMKPRITQSSLIKELHKDAMQETVERKEKIKLNKVRVFESKQRKKMLSMEGNIKAYIIVSFIFVIGFLIGVICFRQGVNEASIKEEVLNYDFFYNTVEDKSIIVSNMMCKNIGLILVYWVIGISVIGAPLLIFVCLYKGMSFAIIVSSILFKHGLTYGYSLLIKNVFLQHFLTNFVIVFLTVSSIKVMYRILFQKQELKDEIIRHSIASIMGLLTLFTTIGINYITILNNFT